MLSISTSDEFNKDIRRLNKADYPLEELWAVVRMLQSEDPFDRDAFRNHPLRGEWAGVRDLHIRPDWLLLYRIEDQELQLIRTGTHADLFES